jgi:hypothetical protein
MALPKIDQPLYDLELPSTKQPLKVRPMLAKEEKLLLMAKESKDENDILGAIKQVVNNCIVTKNVDVDRFAIFDLEYLFLRLRAFSVSNLIDVHYRDNEDYNVMYNKLKASGVPDQQADSEALKHASYQFQIDLNKVEVKFPDPEPDKMIQVNDAITIRMRRPSASLYSNKQFLDADEKHKLDLLIFNCIDAVVQDTTAVPFDKESLEDQVKFLADLPIPVMEKVREYLLQQPNVNYEIKYTNKEGTERTIPFQSLNDFFTLR